MRLRLMSLRSTRWGAAATAALTATAMCSPIALAQGVAGAAVSARPLNASATLHSGFSSCRDAWGDRVTDAISADATGTYLAEKDPGSLYTVGKAIGARGLWAKEDSNRRLVTGHGIGVAVLDTGVNQVAGLNGTGKVTYGPDLSIEGNGVLVHQDTFGHGTYMAGIIAGRGTTMSSSDLMQASAKTQLGVAPDAQILAMKLATRDGSTDVSQVIAALDWVTQNPVMPNGTRIRVINLSYGTNSAQSYLDDPLAAAAENAWKQGIVVVTSAGNNGLETGRLTNPAINPFVIAVGATSSNRGLTRWAYDTAIPAHFSQVGSAARHADLVAPGTAIVSNRAPGSFIDATYPEGRVAGDVTGQLFRGSGTSQAAAVVSGSAALLLQAYPSLTPDQVKYALTSSARPVTKGSTLSTGAGTLDLARAFGTASQMSRSWNASLRTAAVQSFPSSTGQGSINAARGDSVLVDPAGVDLTGEIDVQGNTWNPAAWWLASSSKTSWSGGEWLGNTWTGDTWATSTRWSASRWSASRWSTADWASSSWTASRWSASRWSASRWSSSFWAILQWTDLTGP